MDAFVAFEGSVADVTQIADHAESLLAEGGDEEARNLANSITRSGLVLLCGYFEGYIRELLQEVVDRVNDAGVDINLLPDRLLAGVIEAAFSLSGPRRVEALTRLRNQIKGSLACELDRKRLSVTGGNPTVDVIEGLLEGLGIEGVIDVLSVRDFSVDSTYSVEHQSKALESAVAEAVGAAGQDVVGRVLSVIDAKWLPKRRRRSVGYVSAIEELLKRRNRIAHGESRELVTPEELRTQAVVIRRLAKGLCDSVSDWLERLLERVSAAVTESD